MPRPASAPPLFPYPTLFRPGRRQAGDSGAHRTTMKPTEHPLQKALEARVRLLETTLQPSTVKQYRRTVRLFLGYLSQNFPEVHRPSQLRRDPHALGWLEYL